MNKKTRWYTPFIHKVLLAAAVAAGDTGARAFFHLDRAGD